jgi:uncharacterized protein
MRIDIDRSLEGPTIIVGFPGVGLVGPIVTEFLISHMQTTRVGTFQSEELPPMAAIHKGQLVHPMSLHYSEKHHALIVYTILNLKGHEWQVANAITTLAKDVKAAEILCIDGAASDQAEVIYSFGNPQLTQLGAKPMEESVLMGVSAALMLAAPKVSCLFATTQLEMPDSKAAADVVKFLDKYLGLEVDYQPLLEEAAKFEQKLKSVLSQTQKLAQEREKKDLGYLG